MAADAGRRGADGALDLAGLLRVLSAQAAMLTVGYAAGRAMPRLDYSLLVKFVWYLALPAILFRSTATLDAAAVDARFLCAMVSAKAVLALFAGVFLAPRLLPGPRLKSAALCALLTTCSNDLALGLPIVAALVPPMAEQVVLLAALQNLVLNPVFFALMDAADAADDRADDPAGPRYAPVRTEEDAGSGRGGERAHGSARGDRRSSAAGKLHGAGESDGSGSDESGAEPLALARERSGSHAQGACRPIRHAAAARSSADGAAGLGLGLDDDGGSAAEKQELGVASCGVAGGGEHGLLSSAADGAAARASRQHGAHGGGGGGSGGAGLAPLLTPPRHHLSRWLARARAGSLDAHGARVCARACARAAWSGVRRAAGNYATLAVFLGGAAHEALRWRAARGGRGGRGGGAHAPLHLPEPLETVLRALSCAFPPAANIALGLSLSPRAGGAEPSGGGGGGGNGGGGGARTKRPRALATAALVSCKLLLLPMLCRALVTLTAVQAPAARGGAAGARPASPAPMRFGSVPAAVLYGNVAWVYGALPTAPWVAAFAHAYGHHTVMTSRAISTSLLLSFPLVVVASILFLSPAEGPSASARGVARAADPGGGHAPAVTARWLLAEAWRALAGEGSLFGPCAGASLALAGLDGSPLGGSARVAAGSKQQVAWAVARGARGGGQLWHAQAAECTPAERLARLMQCSAGPRR